MAAEAPKGKYAKGVNIACRTLSTAQLNHVQCKCIEKGAGSCICDWEPKCAALNPFDLGSAAKVFWLALEERFEGEPAENIYQSMMGVESYPQTNNELETALNISFIKGTDTGEQLDSFLSELDLAINAKLKEETKTNLEVFHRVAFYDCGGDAKKAKVKSLGDFAPKLTMLSQLQSGDVSAIVEGHKIKLAVEEELRTLCLCGDDNTKQALRKSNICHLFIHLMIEAKNNPNKQACHKSDIAEPILHCLGVLGFGRGLGKAPIIPGNLRDQADKLKKADRA